MLGACLSSLRLPAFIFVFQDASNLWGSWLAALLPGLDRGERRGLVESDRVQVDGRGATSANQVCPAGAKIEIELAGSVDAALGVDAAAEFGRGGALVRMGRGRSLGFGRAPVDGAIASAFRGW